MKFIKIVTDDGQTEFINLDKVLTVTPLANGKIKILLGAGLYYTAPKENAALLDLSDNDINALMRGLI